LDISDGLQYTTSVEGIGVGIYRFSEIILRAFEVPCLVETHTNKRYDHIRSYWEPIY